MELRKRLRQAAVADSTPFICPATRAVPALFGNYDTTEIPGLTTFIALRMSSAVPRKE